ncbi:hypothetical protein NDU88_002885 [Pleurodeles waltl]|uniref:Uncharacterized protein n=1 Tax=Pleurodeles waltl TaxID=8319 RepID=A0AAV7UYZ6_PLEWA|nr:hypothetical protein NDU88_002885 [Pleurodeles waltl]
MGERRAAESSREAQQPGTAVRTLEGRVLRSAIAAAWRPEEEMPYAGPARPWGCSGAPEPRAGVWARSASHDPPAVLCIPGSEAEESKKKQLQCQESKSGRDVLKPWLGGPAWHGLSWGWVLPRVVPGTARLEAAARRLGAAAGLT